jgi:hypothetical protein
MRLLGLLSLVAALAIVGVVAARQMQGAGQVAGFDAAAVPSAATPTGNVNQQSQQLQEKLHADVTRALEQGARKSEPDQ